MDALKFNRLLRKIQSDKRAVEKLYEEYYPKIVYHVRRRFGNLVSPEDITQNVFLALLTTEITTYVEHPTAWLYTLVDNKAKDLLRVRHEEIALSEMLVSSFCIDSTILKEDMKQCLKGLDPISQQIIYLHIWEGYSYIEIAEELGVSCSNVRVKVSRAYKFIKQYL